MTRIERQSRTICREKTDEKAEAIKKTEQKLLSELTRLISNNLIFFHQLKRRSLQMSSEFACGTVFDDFEDCVSDSLSALNEEFDSVGGTAF